MIQSLDRGLTILNIIAEKSSLGVTELAKELSVDKSTVSRLLETLKHHDFVQVDKATGKYRLGFRILHLGESLKDNLDVMSIARGYLSDLSDEINESVHLCAFNNNLAYVIDQVKSKRVYSLSATVGMKEPFHCSSVGKCILAYRRPETIQRLLENYEFKRYTDNTIGNAQDLMAELEKIRRLGYAVDDEEMAAGVRCLAVPVFNYRNSVRYSIGISGPKSTINSASMERYIKKMVSTARLISKGIGCNNIDI